MRSYCPDLFQIRQRVCMSPEVDVDALFFVHPPVKGNIFQQDGMFFFGKCNPVFWVGVFEQIEGGKLTVSKVTFGVEPKDYEVYDFILHHYYELKFSPPVSTDIKQAADNPKRRQRNARKQMQSTGVGTKSQQALQLQLEEIKTERKQKSKEQKEAEK